MARNASPRISFPDNSPASSHKCCATKASDILHILRQKVALLTGGRDKSGRPLITFPCRDNPERCNPDDMKELLNYLYTIPSDETKELGFAILIDMRHAITWNSVKPILKTLQDSFAGSVHCVYIIKPKAFLEKQKANLGSTKYKFEVQMVDLVQLYEHVDVSQLYLIDSDGQFVYDHDEWLTLRTSLERLVWQAMDVLRTFAHIKAELETGPMPVNVESAKQAIDKVNHIKKTVDTTPILVIEQQGMELIQRLTGGAQPDEVSSDYGSSGRENPDFTSAAPHVAQLLESMRKNRLELDEKWQERRNRLYQCQRLKLFQVDADEMFKWIRRHVQLLLSGYAEIGHTYESSKEVQTEHEGFSSGAKSVQVNVDRVLDCANRLLESGHYAEHNLQTSYERLKTDWGLFSDALDLRSNVLILSVKFHAKAKEFRDRMPERLAQARGTDDPLPSSVSELEGCIQEHQQFMDSVTREYSEVHGVSKQLLYDLDVLVQHCLGVDSPNSTYTNHAHRTGQALISALKSPPNLELSDECESMMASTPDYTQGANHVLEIIHDLLGKQRNIEAVWQPRRVRLHQRLALQLFQHDVKQVLDWLNEYGEPFLLKNLGIGKTLERAKILQESQQRFENVSKNTYTNAEKLVAAARELAGTGECQPEEMHNIGAELQRRIAVFAKRVQSRKHLVNLSALYHTHHNEMLTWYERIEHDAVDMVKVGDSLHECEHKQDVWLARTDATMQAYATVLSEGQQLLALVRQQASQEGNDNAESIQLIENMLALVERKQAKLSEKWVSQRQSLTVGHRFRLFEQDCITVNNQLDGWMGDMRTLLVALTPDAAEKMHPLHEENKAKVHEAILEIMQHAQENMQILQQNDLKLVTSDATPVLDLTVQLAQTVKKHEVEVMKKAELVEQRLHESMQLGRLQEQANQVLGWIANQEHLLNATLTIPTTLAEANQLLHEFSTFTESVYKINSSSEKLSETARNLISNDHHDQVKIRQLVDQVICRWRELIALTDTRQKLLNAAVTYYKTFDSVVPVLSNLCQDYQQVKDWCSLYSRPTAQAGAKGHSGDHLPRTPDKVTFITQLLSKHTEKKEMFLRSCTYGRKNSHLFLRYIRRSVSTRGSAAAAGQVATIVEKKVMDARDDLVRKEDQVIALWTYKKKQLDQCQAFVLLEASAKSVLDWLTDTGEIYLSTHLATPRGGSRTREQTEALLQEHYNFKTSAKEHREKVKIFLELAEGIKEKQDGKHTHKDDIQEWMNTVRTRYEDFSNRMDKLERALQTAAGRPDDKTKDLALDRCSDPNMTSRMMKHSIEFEGLKRKSVSKKEYIMAELLNTEQVYVNDLNTCIKHYLNAMQTATLDSLPVCLRGKEELVFSNIQDICQFHRDVFLRELEKYKSLPENIGHCFVNWAEKYQMYVTYCKNKDQSNHLIGKEEVINFFAKVQREQNLSLPLQAYLIKPVQRITKYQLLLKELLKELTINNSRVEETLGPGEKTEIEEALEVMLSVPKRANDSIHLSLLDGCQDIDSLGDFIVQDSFCVWDPKQIIKKAKDRHVFLFEMCLLFTKKIPDLAHAGKFKYQSKHRLMLSEINVTEHIEGDECKFALWTGHVPNNEYRTIFKARDHAIKVEWVKKLRDLLGEKLFNDLRPLAALRGIPKSNRSSDSSHLDIDRTSREMECLGTNAPNGDALSLHSVTSSVSSEPEQSTSKTREEYCEAKGHQVKVVERSTSHPNHLVSSDHTMPVSILSSPSPEVAELDSVSLPYANSSSGVKRLFSVPSASQHSQYTAAPQEIHRITPPLASAEDLQDIENESERSSSVRHTPLSEQMQEEETPIDMPPPMGTNALDQTLINGAEDPLKTPVGALAQLAMNSVDDGGDNGDDPGVPEVPDVPDVPAMSPQELARYKRGYVLAELVETERDYVRDLGCVIDGYMGSIASMQLPEDVVGKDRIVFANIDRIYEFHKCTFLKEIEKCLVDYDACGRAFVKYERRLHMYVVYCQNKPKSEFLVQGELEQFFTDIKAKLGHKLALPDLLIKPVQRIMKYQLLLKDIYKYTERAGDSVETLKKASDVMHRVPKQCDDMMQVGRLQAFDGSINAQGALKMQGNLLISENPPTQVFKGKDRRIFLFEQSAIIADCIMPRKEFSNPSYIFKSLIKVNKMALLKDVTDEPLRFILKNNEPTCMQEFLLQAASLEEKDTWIRHINVLLDAQNQFLMALQNPKLAAMGGNNPAADSASKEDKSKGKSPLINRIIKGKSTAGRSDSANTAANHSDGTHSSPGQQPGASPKSGKSRLFEGFRNTFRSSSSVKSPSSPPPVK